MPYLGNEPGAITDAFTDTFSGNGSNTGFTLTRASTTNSVFVRIHGVMQRNGTDFTVDGTTLTFTTAPPNASNNVVVQFFTVGSVQTVADNAITQAKLGTNAVTNAKVADDAIGVAELSATGTPSSSTFLRGDNAWAEAGGGWEFISTVTADDDADVSFTNMVAGYDYQYRWTNMTPMTNDSGRLQCRLGVSGPTYRTSSYLGSSAEFNHFASYTNTEATTFIELGANAYDGTSPDGAWGSIDLYNPVGNTVTKVISHCAHRNSGHTFYNVLTMAYYSSAESHPAFQFLTASGNIEAGDFVQYRRKIS